MNWRPLIKFIKMDQGGLPKSLNLMQDFRASLLHCGLVDLGFQSNIFTWNNGRHGEEFVQERLDQACATDGWREIFPYYRVTNIQASYSDHVLILITTQNTNQHGRRKKLPRTAGAQSEIFCWGGRDNIIILICNSRKIQSMTYIHIYISSCISLKKNIKSNENQTTFTRNNIYRN